MRLWHKYLIWVLPRQQLIGQWRECCCIAKNIAQNGTPNHLLVNKVMEYPISEFCDYCNIVLKQMVVRGYNVSGKSIRCLEDNVGFCVDSDLNMGIFKGWHNDRYLTQCFYNLHEKYDCGGISEKEWETLRSKYKDLISSEEWGIWNSKEREKVSMNPIME